MIRSKKKQKKIRILFDKPHREMNGKPKRNKIINYLSKFPYSTIETKYRGNIELVLQIY